MEKISFKERELWPDIIRIFAIYGVIALHTLNVYPSWAEFYSLRIFEASVPLFIMLSGALLLRKSESYFIFFKKRTLKVLVPWIFWTIIYMLFFYLIKDEYVYNNYFNSEITNLTNWINFFIIQLFTGLWFLPLIFGIYLITPPIRGFIKGASERDIIYVLILWFIFISFLPWVFSNVLFPQWLPMFIYAPIQYSGYFILGYLLFKKNGDKFKKIPLWFIIPLLALLLLLPINTFLEPATVIGTSLIFAYLYALSFKVNKKIGINTRKFIITLSTASLGVYAVHGLVMYVLIKFSDLPNSLNVLSTLFVFLISLITIVVIQKIPLIKNIVP